MKNLILLVCILIFLSAPAQKQVLNKVIQKPILLKAQTKTQTIGMEYKEDILYFAKVDILPLVQNMANIDRHPVYMQVIGYLNAAPNEIALKQKDSVKFNNVGERNLYKMIIELTPEMRSTGMTSVMNKKTKQFNAPKTNIQTISMDYGNEVLYFSKTDLVSVLTNKSQNDKIHVYNPIINYLNNANKPVLFKYDDTTALVEAGEKNLRKIILEVAPQLLVNGKAADKVKKTNIFNKQIFLTPCSNGENKKSITEKKGRIIFECKDL